MPPTETKVIRVSIDTSGAPGVKALADSLGLLNNETKKISGGIKKLNDYAAYASGALASVFAGIGIRELVSMSDAIQLTSDRIGALGSRTMATRDILESLNSAATRTKSGIADSAVVFSRLSSSLASTGISSGNVVKLTETLQNVFRLSGATTAETTNSLIQLSQAFSSGTLRGDEFRSIMEQSSVMGDILSKSLGKSRGELKKMSEQGLLTSDKVLKALYENMKQVNDRAKLLTPTFGQTLTVAMNDFNLAVLDLNKNFNISGNFAKMVSFLKDNLPIVIGLFVSLAAIAASPAIIALGTFLAGLSLPVILWAAALGTVVAGIVAIITHFKELKKWGSDLWDSLRIGALKFNIALLEFDKNSFLSGEGRKKALASQISAYEGQIESILNQQELVMRTESTLAARNRYLQEEADRKKGSGGGGDSDEIDKRQKNLARLNKSYEAGIITVSDYFTELRKIDELEARRQFRTGKKDLEQYKAEQAKQSILELNDELKYGTLLYSQYSDAIDAVNLQQLQFKWDSGKISLQEYDAELVNISKKYEAGSSFRKGTEDFIRSAGTLSQGIAGVITKTYDTLGEAFFQFTAKGQRNFSDMTQAILDDLLKIIIRSQIISPLAKGLLDFMPSAAGAGQAIGSGNPRYGETLLPDTKYASGGVITGRSSFLFGQGKVGMAGEAGPEAILPLRRGPGGELGIQSAGSNVTVNVINNSSSSVEQRESTDSSGAKTIDLIIHNKVREGIASGRYDRAFNQTYGINRKGS